MIAVPLALAAVACLASGDRASATGPVLGGALPGSPPGPLFPADNWWSVDVSSAPVAPNSTSYIQFINNCSNCCPAGRHLHPDFGGDVAPGSVQTYGMPYAVVDGTQPQRTVIFQYADESDGVDHTTNTSYPFYPLPDEAITQPHWVEGGDPAAVDLRSQQDRHLIVVDRDHRYLYELWNVWYDSAHAQWYAGSGAFFNMNTNDRRPETWTSADAAGLAILPGLVRYEEVYDSTAAYEIPHAFRVTVRATNGHVYPASHSAGSTAGALPMGARLRLKASRDISGFSPEIQRIFNAMKKHGLIVADNGSDMFITGTYDPRWNNDLLNPAFAQLTACDFEVVELGWNPTTTVAAVLPLSRSVQVGGASATAFAAIINPASTTALNCAPAPPSTPPAGLGTFTYQTTTPGNLLTGTPNTPANISPGVVQNYVFGFSPTAAIPQTSLAMRFLCDNTAPAAQTPGVNNFFVVADTSPVPDTIALMATVSGDGIVRIPGSGAIQLFAIGTSNVGATGSLVVSGDTGGVTLPLTLTVCETTGGSTCLAPPTPTVTVIYAAGTNRSFAFFAQASGSIPFDPAANRVFAQLTQAGVLRGATSAAVCTTPNAGC